MLKIKDNVDLQELEKYGFTTSKKMQKDLLIDILRHELSVKDKRIDKAIEYIKSTQLYGMRSGKTLYSKVMQETINILRGENDE